MIPAAYTWFAMYHPWFSSKNAASINQRKKYFMSTGIHWGVIGTGSIAHRFARGLAESQTGTLLAVGSRTQETAETFGETWRVPHRHGSYEALLRDKEVQAVYISTPHPWHVKWAIAAAEAGKHILCEKPIALNYAETLAIVEAARRNDVFLMEAFMYRCHPQTTRLVELVRTGVIGQVRVIQATFSFDVGEGYNPQGRLLNNTLGGGGILDVGCYCASIARLLAGAALGQPFANPLTVVGIGSVGETRVDEYAVASLLFPEQIVAELLTGVRVNAGSEVRILGSEGSISLSSPFTPGAGESRGICVKRDGEPEEQISLAEDDLDLYALEAETVAQYIEKRQAPAMSWEDTLGNMRTLDQWRAALGVVYDAEISTRDVFSA
jgi:predicted dehydrogenase